MYRRREREREEGSRYNVNERWKAERSGEISLSISLAGEAPARMRHRVGIKIGRESQSAFPFGVFGDHGVVDKHCVLR